MLIVNDPLTLLARIELIDAMLALGYRVDLVSPSAPIVDELVSKGCLHTALAIKRRGTNPVQEAMLFLKLYSIIRAGKPDVVLSFTIKPNMYGGLICRILGKSLIANITGLGTAVEDGGTLSRGIMSMYRLSLRRASCVFLQNKANLELIKFHLHSDTPCRLLPGSGVSLTKHHPLPFPDDYEVIRFLYVGRVMKNKGIDELISVAEGLKHTGRFQLDVLGICEDDYEPKLREAHHKGTLNYHGFQNDVTSWLLTSHCVVLPSYHEGMANVLLEAAASARPVIASNIPGCQEAFDEGVSGLGCEPRSADSLKKAIIGFMGLNSGEMRAMGLAGRQKMESSFDRGIITRAYVDEITQAVKER